MNERLTSSKRYKQYLRKQFEGSAEQGRSIRTKCLAAVQLLQEIEDAYAEIGRVEQHKDARLRILDAGADIMHLIIEPIEAKFPELKE